VRSARRFGRRRSTADATAGIHACVDVVLWLECLRVISTACVRDRKAIVVSCAGLAQHSMHNSQFVDGLLVDVAIGISCLATRTPLCFGLARSNR